MSDEDTVRRGYDRMADQYLSSKDPDDPVTEALLDAATGTLPGGSAALDLGCGAGVPVTQWHARRFLVTGVDVSASQVELVLQRYFARITSSSLSERTKQWCA